MNDNEKKLDGNLDDGTETKNIVEGKTSAKIPEKALKKADAKTTDNKTIDKKKKDPSKGISVRIKKFFLDIKSEVKKIVWPSRKHVTNNTIVVLVVIAAAAAFISLIDALFGSVVNLILR